MDVTPISKIKTLKKLAMSIIIFIQQICSLQFIRIKFIKINMFCKIKMLQVKLVLYQN